MRRIGFLALALVLLIAGCGGTTASSTPTLLPLTETFTSIDGSISFKYPAGWFASEILGQITVANTQAAAEAATPAPGQFQTRMIVGPISAVTGLAAESTPQEVIQFFAQTLSAQGVTFSQPIDLTLGAYSAARVEGTAADGQGVVMAVNIGDGNYNIVSATSAIGEMTRFEPMLRLILETLVYTPPAAVPSEILPEVTAEASG
ncbi:MAG: hypothetical protein K8L97_04960 [Anaerolineae bacterium]|nr:hypothetical protein [Anaerolineae bacterium]